MFHPLPSAILVWFAISLVVSPLSVALGSYAVPILAALVLPVLGVMLLNPHIALSGIGVVILTIVMSINRVRWKPFLGVQCGLLMVMSVIHHRAVRDRVGELLALRERYPVESLRRRLEFHEEHPVPGGPEAAAAARPESQHFYRGSREYQLRVLHEDWYLRFVQAGGFGIFRMPRPRRETIELPRDRMPMRTGEVCFDLEERPGRPRPAEATLQNIFKASTQEFSDLDWMGRFEHLDRVIGFEPHAVRSAPQPLTVDSEIWQVARFELVSLLKHDRPVVYVSEELPTLENLDRFPTRSLDAFESRSLESLRAGEETVIFEEPSTIAMLGAIRASESCQACHPVPKQELLGAFSYEFRPILVGGLKREQAR